MPRHLETSLRARARASLSHLGDTGSEYDPGKRLLDVQDVGSQLTAPCSLAAPSEFR